MANHKSALKKHRRDQTRRMINKGNRTRMRNKIKLLRQQIDTGNLEDAKNLYPDVMSTIDKNISKGTIHQNTGSRYKSRLSLLLKKSGVEI